MNDDTNVITVSDLKIGESIPRWITVYKPNYLKIFNSTITGNSAEQSGGGIATLPGSNQFTSSTITITNSIVAGNTAESSAQVEGTFFDNSNIIQDSIEGLLDPVLRDNGGPTKTHALLPGSAAINAGDNQAATDAGFTTDQRGGDHQRIYAGTADIGAFEYHALNLVVDTLSDEDDGDYSSGHLSLREAIKLANQTFDTDQITFSNTLSGGTIMLESELLISTGMHIVGLGQGQLTLDGGNDSRIFRVNDGDTYSDAGVEISGLSLKHGNADRGGAILNYEELLLTDVALSENVAAEDGGAIYHASGQLRVTDSFFSYNRAQKNGGGIYNSHQDLIVEETTFYRNTSGAGGGGIYSIYGSKLKHSRPDTLPGPAFPVLRSIYTPLYFLNYGDTEYNVVAILHSSFLENEASSGGGVYMTQKNYTNPLWNCDAVTVSGLGGTADVSSQQNSDKISLTGNKIVGCTFVGNTAVRGGGLFTSSQLTISDSTFTENSAYYGGGVYHTARTLTVQNSTVSGNSATRSGGGIYSKPDYPFSSPVPINLELIRSEALVSIPLAPEVMFLEIGVDLTTGLSSDQVALDSASSSFDANSTNALSATDAVISSAADLLFVIKSSVLRIQNSTITGNSAGANGGGLYLINADNSYIRSSNDITNSIIAGNSAPENAQVEGGFDGGFNIIQDSTEGLLDPVLRDNGGPTKTHALLPGSAAIDAGSNQAATDAGLTTDQRGEGSQRIKEGTVDIGAFEVQAPFTQVDFRFANSNSRKLNNGEQEQLPENRIWLDEAGNYWVEIWLHTPTSTTAGIQSGYFDLNYNTSVATAVSIEYGATFAHNQSGTINQNTGTIENLSAETSRTDIGDDQYTLFARIQFHANMTESTDGERGRHPRTSVVNPDISVNQLNIRLTGGTASEAIVNQSPGDPIWEDPQSASDIPAFDDLVLANLQFDYYVQPDDFFAPSHISPNNEYAYHSGLTLIDLPGSPVVDEAGNETGMLNELDSLVGSRDETEDDLPKKTTSTDHDSSAEDDSDRFFTDLTEETELIVF
ncbi:choice-of-anchor Q domain-containing protein [Gimesia sp.]|uniref:choice-of-anchor Q domain-containing protein n=1 Tax=Gimesia sp. TaxID=2024833 RepID=UPI003A8CD4E4